MSSSVSTRRAARTTFPGSRRSRAARWVTAFVAVTLLHGLAAQWFVHHRDIAQPAAPTHIPVQVALLKPQQIERSAPPPAAAATTRPGPHAVAQKPHGTRAHTLSAITHEAHPKVPAQPAKPAEPARPAPDTSALPASAPVAASAPAASAPPGAQTAQGNGTGDQPKAQPGPASHGVKFSVPPSGDLSYDTFYNGMRNQPGTIHWSSDGQHYEMVVSVPLPFIGTFSWTSRGRIDAFGLAPDTYTEKRGHRPEDVTIFNRDSRQIAFTRTPNALPLPDGAQDRFSMVMQLASLVRGDPDAYRPGVTREFFVADNDSGETWPVTTIGDESVNTDHGFVTARHFMRLPRREGDRRRIDVWLAPSLGWLPVRLVQTEPNGTQFELVWRGPLVLPSTAQAASDAGAEAPGANGANRALPSSSPDQGSAPAEASGANNASGAGGTVDNSGSPSENVPPAPPAPASSPASPGTDTTTPTPTPTTPPSGHAANIAPEAAQPTQPIAPFDASVKP